MIVFISSTPKELVAYQEVACEVVRELGMEPVLRDSSSGLRRVKACTNQVKAADALLAIVGHRRGPTPEPEIGGDGLHPWSWWETRAAFEHGVPVAVLMAADTWQSEFVEDDPNGRAVMSDFRGELARLAAVFDGTVADFRQLTRTEIVKITNGAMPVKARGVELRRWSPPTLPGNPYPVLLPYTNPDLMAGRSRELGRLRHSLARPLPILGLHGPSGIGKSSLLIAGLVPALRGEGRPVAFERHPREPGIVQRLLGDLVTDGLTISDDDVLSGGGFRAFVDLLVAVRGSARAAPLLVIDQFEDLFYHRHTGRARAVAGTLLAASVQRQPGLETPPCKWLLAYRQTFHGELLAWLGDVLRDARFQHGLLVSSLPQDLSGPDRFHACPLSPLGTPEPGTDDRTAAATQVFRAAIEKPLELTSDSGEKVYPWCFAQDGAARLARAFGEARIMSPKAPLTPELQAVLAYLQEAAWTMDSDGRKIIEVPDDPSELIDRALEEHLRHALDRTFPVGKGVAAKIGRTRALLALRELADVHGWRDRGRPAAALAQAIGYQGREVLEKLATDRTRLVLPERHGNEQVYVLSHDRLAEVVVRLVDNEGTYASFGVDNELLGLRRFVTLQRELFTAGEIEQSTKVSKGRFAGIKKHANALLWDDEARRWWQACRDRQDTDRRRMALTRGLVAGAVLLLTVAIWIWSDYVFERRELLATIESGGPEVSFRTLARLTAETSVDSAELLQRVRKRVQPFDVLERGLGGVDEEQRGPALIRVAELLLPLVQEEPEDPVRIASTVWALDFFAAYDPALQPRAAALREEVLRGLRRKRPSPPGPDDPNWAYIPAGTFLMSISEQLVQLSAFRLMVHEVTNAELRRFYPWAEGEDELPAMGMTWFEAYTYAAWLGGRLPTEVEWEYAASAGCRFTWCKGDGTEATVDDVAWWVGSWETGEPSVNAVMQLEPNPWGIYDAYGNVSEICANWDYTQSERQKVDPPGPTRHPMNYRVIRGGSAWDSEEAITATRRDAMRPDEQYDDRYYGVGFRVAIPGRY